MGFSGGNVDLFLMCILFSCQLFLGLASSFYCWWCRSWTWQLRLCWSCWMFQALVFVPAVFACSPLYFLHLKCVTLTLSFSWRYLYAFSCYRTWLVIFMSILIFFPVPQVDLIFFNSHFSGVLQILISFLYFFKVSVELLVIFFKGFVLVK